MLTESVFDNVHVSLLFGVTVLVLLGATEIGFRLGLWRHKRMTEGEKGSVNTMMGSTLGLLAFMLAFTFNMSSSRFDARKQLAQEEASAILRAYQRAQFLPEPQRTESSRLLQEYVNLRLEQANVKDFNEIKTLLLRSEKVQDALWQQAAALSDRPSAVLAGFMQSLAELTDLQVKRVRAVAWNRMPLPIVVALYGIAFLGLGTIGYSSGLTESRAIIPATVLVLIFSAVIALIIDLERPKQDMFSVPQEPMIETAQRIHSIGD